MTKFAVVVPPKPASLPVEIGEPLRRPQLKAIQPSEHIAGWVKLTEDKVN